MHVIAADGAVVMAEAPVCRVEVGDFGMIVKAKGAEGQRAEARIEVRELGAMIRALIDADWSLVDLAEGRGMVRTFDADCCK